MRICSIVEYIQIFVIIIMIMGIIMLTLMESSVAQSFIGFAQHSNLEVSDLSKLKTSSR